MAGSRDLVYMVGGEGQLVIEWSRVRGFQGLGFKALRVSGLKDSKVQELRI